MTENVPDSFDHTQPDLPTMAVDPNPIPESHEGQDTSRDPVEETDSGGADDGSGLPAS